MTLSDMERTYRLLKTLRAEYSRLQWEWLVVRFVVSVIIAAALITAWLPRLLE